ncbi:facilitated trehalose transporter Tret1-like isoform X2 [Anthonomus grandis grandis]|nr:facilitated trehalose transporter Tret1-like isoform X2 [Anthonomus grandis grandis]XP_050304283.1 facilitated trehalose transporter Tret1-like isoform X2 [Anthonomus grandis grandis]
MSYAWSAPMLPYFLSNSSHIPITPEQFDQVEPMFFYGALAGMPLSVFIINCLGRKHCLLLSASLTCSYWLMLLFTYDWNVVYAARFLAGIALNFFIAGPMYIAEIAEPRIRGFLAAIIYIMVQMGFLIVYAIGSYFPYYAVPAIGAVLSATKICMFPFMPESPYYYVYVDKPHEAKASLKKLRSKKTNLKKELEEIRLAVYRQKKEKGRLQDLFLISSNRKALLLTLMLNALQHCIGSGIIIMNIHTILGKSIALYFDVSLSAIFVGVFMLSGVLLASAIIDQIGRKQLLMISSVLTGSVLLIISIYLHLKHVGYNVDALSWIPVICILIYSATFTLGLGTVPMVLTAELFPVKVKTYCIALTELFYMGPGIIMINLYLVISKSYDLYVPFYFFTASSFIGACLIMLFLPETKGKTLEEIQMILKGQEFNRDFGQRKTLMQT